MLLRSVATKISFIDIERKTQFHRPFSFIDIHQLHTYVNHTYAIRSYVSGICSVTVTHQFLRRIDTVASYVSYGRIWRPLSFVRHWDTGRHFYAPVSACHFDTVFYYVSQKRWHPSDTTHRSFILCYAGATSIWHRYIVRHLPTYVNHFHSYVSGLRSVTSTQPLCHFDTVIFICASAEYVVSLIRIIRYDTLTPFHRMSVTDIPESLSFIRQWIM